MTGNSELCKEQHAFVGNGKFCSECGHEPKDDCHIPNALFNWDAATSAACARATIKKLDKMGERITKIGNGLVATGDDLLVLYSELIHYRDYLSKIVEKDKNK
jgi:hypothetical protein